MAYVQTVMLGSELALNRLQITDLHSDQILKIKKNIKFLVQAYERITFKKSSK